MLFQHLDDLGVTVIFQAAAASELAGASLESTYLTPKERRPFHCCCNANSTVASCRHSPLDQEAASSYGVYGSTSAVLEVAANAVETVDCIGVDGDRYDHTSKCPIRRTESLSPSGRPCRHHNVHSSGGPGSNIQYRRRWLWKFTS